MPCKCFCNGISGEVCCLPCLRHTLNVADETCYICFEKYTQAPVIMSGIVFEYSPYNNNDDSGNSTNTNDTNDINTNKNNNNSNTTNKNSVTNKSCEKYREINENQIFTKNSKEIIDINKKKNIIKNCNKCVKNHQYTTKILEYLPSCLPSILQPTSVCQHIFHERCISKQLCTRWPSKRIDFYFRNCPVCRRSVFSPYLYRI